MKLSKITKKMLGLVTAALVLMVAAVVVVSVIVSKNHSDSVMLSQVSVGVGVLENDVKVEADRVKSIALTWGREEVDFKLLAGEHEDIDTEWKNIRESEYDFCCIYDLSGNEIWKSENYDLADPDYPSAEQGKVTNGVVTDKNVPLSVQYISPITYNATGEICGVILVGMDLREDSFLDNVKEQSNSEVTIFAGDERYSTTIKDESGNRAVGTKMSAAINSEVLQSGKEYIGQAAIFGQNHFVNYRPMKDVDGNIVGAYFSGISSAESDDSFRTMVMIAVIVAFILLIAIDAALMILIRKMVGQPIVEANHIAEAMRTGQLGTPDSAFKFGNDEIGNFAKKLEEAKHTLSDYIKDISRMLALMSGGDFTGEPAMEYIGDFTEIEESFKKTRVNLRNIILQLGSSADSVQKGAAQMTEGTNRLADGTSTQSEAIRALIDAIEKISEQIKNNSENAAKADELSKTTADRISNQDKEISNMLAAMTEIENRSKEISDIIKTIEDIAFQTNILALNAAIEAARAGAAGKGFAVVADEVRNLASKSSEAAGNTNELITATISAVNNGVATAERTAAAMAEVRSFSEQTGEYISKISEASNVQSQFVVQIESDAERISGVTEQNSSTAEESAASCEELSGMSNMLREEVAKLKA